MNPVYDKKNPERLLGYIPRRSNDRFFRTIRIPLLDASKYNFSPRELELITPHIRDVILEVEARATDELVDDGWKRITTTTYVLVTDAPLEDLRYIRGWRFPGAQPHQGEDF